MCTAVVRMALNCATLPMNCLLSCCHRKCWCSIKCCTMAAAANHGTMQAPCWACGTTAAAAAVAPRAATGGGGKPRQLWQWTVVQRQRGERQPAGLALQVAVAEALSKSWCCLLLRPRAVAPGVVRHAPPKPLCATPGCVYLLQNSVWQSRAEYGTR